MEVVACEAYIEGKETEIFWLSQLGLKLSSSCLVQTGLTLVETQAKISQIHHRFHHLNQTSHRSSFSGLSTKWICIVSIEGLNVSVFSARLDAHGLFFNAWLLFNRILIWFNRKFKTNNTIYFDIKFANTKSLTNSQFENYVIKHNNITTQWKSTMKYWITN